MQDLNSKVLSVSWSPSDKVAETDPQVEDQKAFMLYSNDLYYSLTYFGNGEHPRPDLAVLNCNLHIVHCEPTLQKGTYGL